MANKYDIFISYSRKDRAEVEALKNRIERDIPGIRCFFDLEEIKSWEEFDEKIITAIDNSDIFLFAASDNAISSESQWPKKEFLYAAKQKSISFPSY